MFYRPLYQIAKSIVAGSPFLKKLIFSYGIRYNLFPKVLTLVLTYRCQCNCVHCGVSDVKTTEEPELSTQEVKALIDQAAKISLIMQITFSGGEPLLRRDLQELIRYSKQHKFFTKIDTNGALLDEQRLRKLKESGLDRIGVSIDHYQGEIHDSLRRYKGLFDNIMKAIKFCESLKISVYLQTYATRKNIENGDLEKLIRLSEGLSVEKIKIQPIATLGSSKHTDDGALTSENFNFLGHILSKYKHAYIESEFLSPVEHKRFCRVNFKSNIHITGYGEVLPCCWFPVSFGNIRKNNLKEILKFMYGSAVFKKLLSCDGCLCSNQEVLNTYLSAVGSNHPAKMY